MVDVVLNAVAKLAKETAKKAVDSASFFGMYQPKEPTKLIEKK